MLFNITTWNFNTENKGTGTMSGKGKVTHLKGKGFIAESVCACFFKLAFFSYCVPHLEDEQSDAPINFYF